jgi:hypothetical protein
LGGSIAFRATLRDGATAPPSATGLWTYTASGLQLLARSDSPAVGSGAGFADFNNAPAIDGANVTFWARLSGLGTGLPNNEGIFSGSPGNIVLKVLEGSQAAGCPAGALYLAPSRYPAVGHSGAIAFRAQLGNVPDGANGGVWSISPAGVTTLIARAGDQVPRLPAGTLYAGFDDPYISDSGRVVVLARVRGKGVTPSSDRVLLVTDPTGLVYPLLRSGDPSPTGGLPPVIDEIVFDSGQPSPGAPSSTTPRPTWTWPSS